MDAGLCRQPPVRLLLLLLKNSNSQCFGSLQVVLVRWNEPFQKLATCDMEGGIFVWIQYEGRWSVELVNDRGAQVSKESHVDAKDMFMHPLKATHDTEQ